MKQNQIKRVLAIHDLSCFGRCALSVILPTLSVMGIQVVPLPTALLSTHTGGFTDMHFRDLTSDMDAIFSHFSSLGIEFDAVYTGFLGSAAQIQTVENILVKSVKNQKKKPILFIDPVMGDDGELYSTYTSDLADGIRTISRHADFLTPNLTEACLLSGKTYENTAKMSIPNAKTFAQNILSDLVKKYSCNVVVTGVELADNTVANFGFDGKNTFLIVKDKQNSLYPGTGDIFASVTLGKLLQGDSFRDSCESAADFIRALIPASNELGAPLREGVALEPMLGLLLKNQTEEET